MHIKEIQIDGFLTFNNKFKLELNKQLNVIVGTNGAGKTNLLRIISAVFDKDDDYLVDSINDSHNEKSIVIELGFDDEEIDFLNDLYIFSFLSKIFKNGQSVFKFSDISDTIHLIQEFKNSKLLLSCSYENKMIKRKYSNIKNEPLCYPEYQKHSIVDVNSQNHIDKCSKSSCQVKNIFELLIKYTKENAVYNDEFSYSKVVKRFKEAINKDHFERIIELLNHYIDEERDKFIVVNDTIIQNANNGNIKNEEDIHFSQVPEIEAFLDIFIDRELRDLVGSSISAVDDIMHYISKIPRDINIHNFNKGQIIESISNISEEYRLRCDVFEIKNTDSKIYKKIQESFFKIIGKHFDIFLTETKSIVQDYIYQVSTNSDDYYDCSNGERELINFLGLYYGDLDNSVFLIDEPCTKLGSQNKLKLRKEVFGGDMNRNKQYLIVTHDIEMIDPRICEQIIYFKMENGSTVSKVLKGMNENQKKKKKKKLLFENPKVLFAEKLLLVEGYDDYRFMKQFMGYYGIENYQIIIMGGCDSKLWEILDRFEINYKMMYDMDKIFKKQKSFFFKCKKCQDNYNEIIRFTKEGGFKGCGDKLVELRNKINSFKGGNDGINEPIFRFTDKTTKFVEERLSTFITEDFMKNDLIPRVKSIIEVCDILLKETNMSPTEFNKQIFPKIDIYIDEISNISNKKFYIFKPQFKDLEGIAKLKWGNNFGKAWNSKTDSDILELIEEHGGLLNDLVMFLKA